MSDKGGEGDAAIRQSLSAQEIVVNGSVDCNSHAIYGRDVSIIPSAIDDSMAGSNKVRISPIVSFDWPIKHYKGQQVAVDKSRQFVAYVLKGRNGGIVRLIHRRMAERALIKSYKGLVVDIAFAHSDQTILASLDDSATVFVHKIELDKANHIIVIPMMQLSYPDADLDMRMLWCCHIPDDVSDDEDDEDKSLLMTAIIGTKAYVMNIQQLAAEHGAGPHQHNEISHSITEISDHSQKVVLAAFSPDGSAIATASEDGVVHFYEVSNRPVTPRCLYKWSPHGGKPITMLYFLDDHSNTEPSIKYWRFAVTGCNNNTELKLWSCDNWECLQTIRFAPRGDDSSSCLIANIDLTSNYLVLSDISQRVLYILQIYEDSKSDTVHVCSVSEFLLGAPVLSFAIVKVERKVMVDGGNCDDDDPNSDGGEEMSLWKKGVTVHLAAVQPKNLQDMHISYVPQTSARRDSPESLTAASSDSFLPPDSLSELSLSASAREAAVNASSDITTEESPKHDDMVLDPVTSRSSQLSSDRFEAAPGEDDSMDVPTSQLVKSNETDVSLMGDSVSLNQIPSGFADQSEEGSVSEDTPTSSVASAAPSASVLLTPDSFVSSVNKPPAAQEPLASPSSLTRVTPLPDNTNSLLLDGSAFDPGSVSTVSPGTLTPRSSVVGMGGTPPTALLLPPGIDAKNESTEDTARQLEELFNSTVTESNGPPLSSLKLLTEEDLLNETQMLSRSISLPNQPLNTTPLSVPNPNSKKTTYDSKIWPNPPEPPTERSESGDTDESGTNDDAESRSEQSSSEAESVDEELNLKAIERDVEQEEAVAERELSHAASHPTNNAMTEKLSKQMEEVMAAVLTINEQMMALGKDVHALKTKAALPEDRVSQMSKQIAHSVNSGVNSKLDQAVNVLRKEQKSLQDKVSAQTMAKLTQEVKANMEKTVSAEIRRSVVPSVTEAMKPVTRDLHKVMAEKLTAADATFKDQLHKLVHSQTTVDKMGHAVGLAVQDVMLSTHRDSLTQHVLPSFDASIRQAFKQLNSSMSEGLNAYVKQMTESMERVKTKQASTQNAITTSCDRAVEMLSTTSKDTTQQITSSVQKVVQKQVTQAFDGMKSLLVAEVQAIVKQEVESALQGQQRVINDQLEAMRSAAATPAPDHHLNSAGMKMHIDSCVEQKMYDQAFQAALSASDLSMVMYLLNQIPDCSVVLADPCPLSQPTLLSLIQQLSSGLSGSHLDLKFSYLLEAIMNLDAQDAVTQQHMNKIISIAREKLTEFTAKNPGTQHRHTINVIEKFCKSALRSSRI